MKKTLLFTFLLIFNFYFSQKKIIITGMEVNNSFNKTLLIAPVCNSKYMEDYTVFDSTRSDNKKQFIFKIKAIEDGFPRPYKFGITVKPQELYTNSDVFYIKNSDQNIKFDEKGAIYFSKDNLLYNDIQKYNAVFQI